MTEQEQQKPDPGNASPEKWTEDLDPEEMKQVAERLKRESGDA